MAKSAVFGVRDAVSHQWVKPSNQLWLSKWALSLWLGLRALGLWPVACPLGFEASQVENLEK